MQRDERTHKFPNKTPDELENIDIGRSSILHLC